MAPFALSAKPPVGEQEHSKNEQHRLIESFVQIVKDFSGGDCYRLVSGLVDDNKKLENDLEEMHIERRCTFANIRDIMVENDQKKEALQLALQKRSQAEDELQSVRTEADELKGKLVANTAETTKIKSALKLRETEINQLNQEKGEIALKLQRSNQELEEVQGELRKVREVHRKDGRELADLRKKIFPFKKMAQADLVRQLSRNFEEAYGIMHQFLSNSNLEGWVFTCARWNELKNDERIGGIPLPTGNSEAATQMRAAASLRLLAVAASTHIFQPAYLTEQGMEIAEILDGLYNRDKSQAQWLRSVLLGTDPQLQQANGEERAKIVTNDILRSVEFLVSPASETSRFRSALTEWCKKAVSMWMELQQLEIMICGECEAKEKGLEPGALRPLPELPLAQRPGNKKGAPANPAKPNGPVQDALTFRDVVAQVWPVFFAHDLDGDKYLLLKRGYVLRKAQVAAAAREASAPTLPAGNSRREGREIQRRGRMVLSGCNDSVEDLSSFLSKTP